MKKDFRLWLGKKHKMNYMESSRGAGAREKLGHLFPSSGFEGIEILQQLSYIYVESLPRAGKERVLR